MVGNTNRNLRLFLIGVVLIGLCGWFLTWLLGMPLPNPVQLWPTLVMLSGIAALGVFKSRRWPNMLFLGLAELLSGGFFLLFTLGWLSWRDDMPRYWPAFLIIVAVAGFSEGVAIPSRKSYISWAVLALVLAIFFCAYNFNLLNEELLLFLLERTT